MSKSTYRQYRRIACLCLFLIIVPLVFCYQPYDVYGAGISEGEPSLDPIVIQSNEVSMTIHYGMEQQARYGRDVVLSVDIASKTLSGEYELSFILANGKNENEKYSKKIELTEGSVQKITMAIPLLNEVKKIKIGLYDEKNNTVVESVKPFQAMNYGPYKLVGILSDMSSDLSYLSAFGTKCFYLDKSNFPSDKTGLDMLDVIVINDFDMDELNHEQFKALNDFVINGGTLAIGTGNSIEKVMGAFLNQGMIEIKGVNGVGDLSKISIARSNIKICTKESFSELLELISMYENNRINTIGRLEERSANRVFDINKVYMGDSMLEDTPISQLRMQTIIKEVANFSIPSASNILVENDKVLLQKLVYGNGSILVSSFDLGMSTKDMATTKIHSSYLELANIIFENLSPGYQSKLDAESFGSYTGLENAINISNRSQLPNVAVFVVILMIYVVAVGPGIYFILKRVGKSNYLWALVPLITVFFMLLVYVNGFKTRITKPYIGYVAMEHYDEETQKVKGTMTFRLSLPTNKYGSITVDNVNTIHMIHSNFPSYPLYRSDTLTEKDTYLDMSVYHTGITYLDNSALLEVVNKPAFSNDFYESTYEYTSSPGIEGYVRIGEQSISGEVKNIASAAIEDAYVYSNGILVSLGYIDSNESIYIEECPQENLLSTEMLYFSNLFEGMLQYDENKNVIPNSNRKVQVMREVIEELQTEGNGSYFISIDEQIEEENPYYSISQERGSYGTRVLLIPLKEEKDRENQVLVTNMDKYMSVVGGEMQYIAQYRYMFGKSMIADYYFPNDDSITEIFASHLFNETVKGNDTTKLCESVYFFNTITGEYDLVFEFNTLEPNASMVQRVDRDSLKNYVSSDNHIRIRYENGSMGEDVSILPCLSYYKENTHVND